MYRHIASLILTLSLLACDRGGDAANPGNGRSDTAADAAEEMEQSFSDTIPGAWYTRRFAIESGTLFSEIRPGTDLTADSSERRSWTVLYFDDYGARAAEYDYADADTTKVLRVRLLDGGRRIGFIPDQSTAKVIPWSDQMPMLLPNFNALDDRMRSIYQVREIEGESVLGRETKGWSIARGNAKSRIWTWQGIPLRGEIGAIAEHGIEPMRLEALAIDTLSPIPEEKFRLPEGMAVERL